MKRISFLYELECVKYKIISSDKVTYYFSVKFVYTFVDTESEFFQASLSLYNYFRFRVFLLYIFFIFYICKINIHCC